MEYIRDNRLYRQDFNNFANYLQEKWGKNRTWAYQLIGAVEVTDSLKDNVRHMAYNYQSQKG